MTQPVCIQTRSAVFETNSSSSHSLTLNEHTSSDLLSYYGSTEDDFRQGVLPVRMQSFGFDTGEQYATVSSRLAYVLLQAFTMKTYSLFEISQDVALTVIEDALIATVVLSEDDEIQLEQLSSVNEVNMLLQDLQESSPDAYQVLKKIIHRIQYEAGLTVTLKMAESFADMDYQTQSIELARSEYWFDVVFDHRAAIVIEDNNSYMFDNE